MNHYTITSEVDDDCEEDALGQIYGHMVEPSDIDVEKDNDE